VGTAATAQTTTKNTAIRCRVLYSKVKCGSEKKIIFFTGKLLEGSDSMNGTLHLLFAVVVWSLSFFIFGLLHEFGHIAMYRMFGGNNNWTIIMGWGRPIIRTKRITINSLFMLPGQVHWPEEKARASNAILWCSGGFIVNAVCAGFLFFLILYLRQIFPVENFDIWSLDRILRAAFLTNIYIIIGTAIPVTYPFGGLKGMPSDGLRIYYVCREIYRAKSIK
jgi:hypothetical protein